MHAIRRDCCCCCTLLCDFNWGRDEMWNKSEFDEIRRAFFSYSWIAKRTFFFTRHKIWKKRVFRLALKLRMERSQQQHHHRISWIYRELIKSTAWCRIILLSFIIDTTNCIFLASWRRVLRLDFYSLWIHQLQWEWKNNTTYDEMKSASVAWLLFFFTLHTSSMKSTKYKKYIK